MKHEIYQKYHNIEEPIIFLKKSANNYIRSCQYPYSTIIKLGSAVFVSSHVISDQFLSVNDNKTLPPVLVPTIWRKFTFRYVSRFLNRAEGRYKTTMYQSVAVSVTKLTALMSISNRDKNYKYMYFQNRLKLITALVFAGHSQPRSRN